MEIIRISNGNYEEYEALLLRRDNLEKEARGTLILYTKIFGELIKDCFQAEIRCIELKKSIAFIQMCINRGEEFSPYKLAEYIQVQMKSYYEKLKTMAKENEICRKFEEISDEDCKKVKQIYRRLARKLHPDISPVTAEHEELMDLWNRAKAAYKGNDLEELEEIEALVNIFLDDNNIERVSISIPDINKKIEKLKNDIKKIISTDPYRLKYLINDEIQTAEKKKEICSKTAEYEEYEEQLKGILEQLLARGDD